MGIDGISGGKPPIGGAGPTSATSGPSSAKDAFDIGGVSIEGVNASSAAEVSDAARLQSGQLSLDEYLDARVEQAVSHLSGVVSPEQLQGIKDQLREQLQGADPVLRHLVQRASGVVLGEGDA